MTKYVTSREASEKLGLHPNTLRRLAEQEKIEYIKTPSGQRHYNTDSFISKQSLKAPKIDSRVSVGYCRVSSKKQIPDLERQINYIKVRYPNHEIISDIGSGLNYKRKGLQTLLERINNGDVKEVVVTYKDRLMRFGYEIIESLIEYHDGKLVVLNNRPVSKESELADDIIAILTFYTSRVYGSRRYGRIDNNLCGIDKNPSSSTELESATDSAVKEMVRCLEACVQQYYSDDKDLYRFKKTNQQIRDSRESQSTEDTEPEHSGMV